MAIKKEDTHPVYIEKDDKIRLEKIRDKYEYSSIRAVVKLLINGAITREMVEDALNDK